jgi:ribosome biogenesis GTPase
MTIDGVILKGIGGFYYVDTSDGIFECRARGKFRKGEISPCVGDRVKIGVIDSNKKKGSLDVIKDRKNC